MFLHLTQFLIDSLASGEHQKIYVVRMAIGYDLTAVAIAWKSPTAEKLMQPIHEVAPCFIIVCGKWRRTIGYLKLMVTLRS